uniref:F-box domain-containing protein n=1 Tax=Sarcophilus harrisii TaxID=9305 RepID=A0A7N4PIM3_SARHA
IGQMQVIHCICSKCFCLPSKRRIKKRPRVLTLLSLPEDVLFHILKWLPAEDILAIRASQPVPRQGPEHSPVYSYLRIMFTVSSHQSR